MDSFGWVVIAFGVAAAYVLLRYDLYDAAALKWKMRLDPKGTMPMRRSSFF